ncbi:MAG: hypothetical protein ACE5JU_20595 [Candidatus Binatia bacterium]
MRFFDYKKVAEQAGIPPDKMAELLSIMRREFPKDEMMFELHVLRACLAIRDGHVTIDEALKSQPSE